MATAPSPTVELPQRPAEMDRRPAVGQPGHGRPGRQRASQHGRRGLGSTLARHKIWTGVGAFILLIAIIVAATPHSKDSGHTSTVATATPSPKVAMAKASPKIAKPSPSAASTYLAPVSVRNRAAKILTAAVNYYASTFARGHAIAGHTQYSNAYAGLAAMQNPSSAASRFAEWRGSTRIEENASTYENAFQRADAEFNASDEPASISQWQQDTGNLQADITQWVGVVVNYQISTASQADLNSAAATVRADIKVAQHDVALIRQGK